MNVGASNGSLPRGKSAPDLNAEGGSDTDNKPAETRHDSDAVDGVYAKRTEVFK